MTINVGQLLADASPAFRRSADFPLRPHTLAVIRTGAHAYGTNTPQSDNDYLAIVLPRMRHIVGLGAWDHWEPGPEDGLDIKATSVAKFVKLALQGNPNVVETLFYTPENHLYITPEFQTLLDHRDAFLSREVFKRFAGYAKGQFQKMEAGKAAQWAGHKRKLDVQKYGYDPKDASHLIRLLYTAEWLAVKGTLRPEMNKWQREIVTDIKLGSWSLDRVKDFATGLAEDAEREFNHPDCPLPQQPESEFIEILLMEIHRRAVA